MAKKLFVSQPMANKTDEQIETERKAIIDKAKSMYPDIEVLDTFFKGYDGSNPVKFLAMSIDKLSEADIAAFGSGWDERRGCCIEHEICVRYNIPIIFE